MKEGSRPTFYIPRGQWEEIGEGDPKSRLLTTININGLDMHLEAIQVRKKGTQLPSNLHYDEIWHGYRKADDSGSPFVTVKIGRRTYCLFAVPHSQ